MVRPVSAVYEEQLIPLGQGHPLWDPSPRRDPAPRYGPGDGATYVHEVTIGDVGYLTGGSFKRLFNVCAPSSDPMNSYGVYDGFEQLEFNSRLIDQNDYHLSPGFYSVETLGRRQFGMGGGAGIAGVSGGVSCSFETTSDHGAILALGNFGCKEAVMSNADFKNFMVAHYDRWRGYACSVLGLEKELEIILVRGSIKTTHWKNATWTNKATVQGLFVQAQGGGVAQTELQLNVGVQQIGTPTIKWGPHGVAQEDMKFDQCVFLSYYKMKYRIWWITKLEAHAGENSFRRPDDDFLQGSSAMQVVQEDFAYEQDDMDPVNIILFYIFENSEAEKAIACDSDVQDLLGPDDEWPKDLLEHLYHLKPSIYVDDDNVGMLALEDAMKRKYAGDQPANFEEEEVPEPQPEDSDDLDLYDGADQDNVAGPPTQSAVETSDTTTTVAEAEEDIPDPSNDEPGSLPPDPKPIQTTIRGTTITLHAGAKNTRVIEWPLNVLYDDTADSGVVSPLVMNAAGTLVASSFDDYVIRIWRLGSNSVAHCLVAHTDTVWAIAFSPTQNKLVSGSADNGVIIWDIETGQPIHVISNGGDDSDMWSIAFSPDGKTVVAGFTTGAVRLWSVDTGTLQRDLEGHQSVIMHIEFSRAGDCLLTGSDSIGFLWNPMSGELLGSIGGQGEMMWATAFSSEGDRIITGSENSVGRIWLAESGDELVVLREHTGPVRAVAWSPGGQKVATGSLDGSVVISHSYSGERLLRLDDRLGPVNSLTWSRDEDFLACGSVDGSVTLMDGRTGRFLAKMRGHKDKIKSLIFAPDGNRLVSSSDDGTIRVWNTTDILRFVESS
ncbi:quinon protein alcohol dehydrogenase-like superfamily [Cristinia sonorae]|uniref:Quinon protein alcohol dehydrogenase-like superfamily n=1 Tax=Cristinia sonorae TaxID=1940300 RepID=A0A8K0UGV3_9AGAR|nr:quinon protein alcohol dehydrogenase-like superfamily [Cristinia sonorae]